MLGACMNFILDKLPPKDKEGLIELETKKVLRKTIRTNKKLAELKGYSEAVPNKNILLNAITLIEAKDSSEIENIITTHDELFDALSKQVLVPSPAKEVLNYKEAIWRGIDLLSEREIITTNMIVEIQAIIEGNNAGIRKQSGTLLKNEITGEVVYRPPEIEREIRELLSNLEVYINSDDEIDPLIKLGILHYQFESIHPFYDGNGRTGRIINILYLVLKDLIDAPILFLSKYIMENKSDYYRLLREVQLNNNWEEWILYILESVHDTASESLETLININKIIDKTASEIKEKAHKIYSYELVELIFSEFYTRISNAEKVLGVSRKTASNYLNVLVNIGVSELEVRGRENIYINKRLVDIFK